MCRLVLDACTCIAQARNFLEIKVGDCALELLSELLLLSVFAKNGAKNQLRERERMKALGQCHNTRGQGAARYNAPDSATHAQLCNFLLSGFPIVVKNFVPKFLRAPHGKRVRCFCLDPALSVREVHGPVLCLSSLRAVKNTHRLLQRFT